jgi:hypothetical protein
MMAETVEVKTMADRQTNSRMNVVEEELSADAT